MIKAKELRLGNWVRSWENGMGGKPVLVTMKILDKLSKIEPHQDYVAIKEIPLTAEILEAAGFQKSDKWADEFIIGPLQRSVKFSYYILNHKQITIQKAAGQTMMVDGDTILIITNKAGVSSGMNISCPYVHQLQNLFYALTGTELEVKL